ncbi:hypothetical protein BDR07DRAFT_1502508 [Suillus spraguei]|nr:hypothetical protein BDR07DRAFT_1502508 [Suillus spraguei]
MHVPASFPVSEGARGETSKLQPDIEEEFDFEEGLEPGANSDGERKDNDDAVTPTPTPFLPSWSMEKKLDATVEINEQLLEENCTLAARLDSVKVHCILALEEMGDLKKKLNLNKKKTKEGTINVGARGLTSATGLHTWEAKKAAQAEKERQKAEATQQWKAREGATQAICDAHGPTVIFSGSLSSKSKADLLKLAQALDISLDGAQNNPEHVSLIQAQLDDHPQLKDDPKFTGLYGCLLRPYSKGFGPSLCTVPLSRVMPLISESRYMSEDLEVIV